MELIYNAKANRKELVKAVVTLTQQPPAYVGPPTYAYHIGDCIVDRNGNLVVPDNTDEPVVQELIDSLENLGFTCIMVEKHEDLPASPETPEVEESEAETSEETADPEFEETEDEEEEPEKSEPDDSEEEPDEDDADDDTDDAEPEKEPTHITLSFPVDYFAKDAIDRMKAIVASKSSLLKKALDTDNLDITVEDGKVVFPWFTDHGLDGEMDAYSKLTFAIAKMAITQNRVTATEKQNPDEKLAMRLFLIRLNFIGDEYKTARAILMRNFNSSTSRKQAESAVNLCMPEVYTPAAKEVESDEQHPLESDD